MQTGVMAALADFSGGIEDGRGEGIVSLVSYREGSSDSELEEEEEYIVPRKKPRLDKDLQGTDPNFWRDQFTPTLDNTD